MQTMNGAQQTVRFWLEGANAVATDEAPSAGWQKTFLKARAASQWNSSCCDVQMCL